MMSAMRMTKFVSVVSAKITMSAMREIRLSVKCESVSVVSAKIMMSAVRGEILSL